jgi:acylphosphatase
VKEAMAKHLSIVGRVQGVGYRAHFDVQARALGLSGWVRNRRDGSVEAVVSGNAKALEDIIEWTRRGPPAAGVTGVTVSDTDDAVVAAGRFEVLPTL